MSFAKLSFPRSQSSIRLPSDSFSLPWKQMSQPAAPAMVSRLMAETTARFAAHAHGAFPNFLITILSWAIAEFLAGCAAYAEAMYPNPAIADDRVDLRDPVPCALQGVEKMPADTRHGLRVISGGTRCSMERHGPVPPYEQTRPAPSAWLPVAYGIRPKQPANASWRWYISVSAPLLALLSKMREVQARRRDVTELRTLDQRTQRDIGISRYDIEAVASRGRRSG